jgi:beta-lactamase regulating signal transducer with metallopeptidase domain
MLWWLLQNAFGAALLAAAAFLLTRAVRLSPSARHALWLVVIAKLLAPPLLLWACPWETPAVATSESAGPIAASAPSFNAITLFVWIWLAGTAATAIFQSIRLANLYARLRGARKAPKWMREEVRRLSDRMGVAQPRVAVAANVGSPLIVGGLWPRLVVPQDLLAGLDRSAWRTVLVHELAHLKRRDHWVGWLEFAASCLWWWNPVFWYARRRLRESAEFACDAWVVRVLPRDRRGYAESLITVVDTYAWKPAPVAAIGMAAAGKRIFERRLEMILREAVPHRMSPLTAVFALIAALVVLPGLAQPVASATETPLPTPAPAVAQPASVALASVPAVEAPAPAKAVVDTPKPQKPAVKPAAKSKRISTATAKRERPLNKVEKPASVEPQPAPTAVEKPKVAELQNVTVGSGLLNRSVVEDAFNTPKEEPKAGPRKIEVHGEVRIRAQKYSTH